MIGTKSRKRDVVRHAEPVLLQAVTKKKPRHTEGSRPEGRKGELQTVQREVDLSADLPSNGRQVGEGKATAKEGG